MSTEAVRFALTRKFMDPGPAGLRTVENHAAKLALIAFANAAGADGAGSVVPVEELAQLLGFFDETTHPPEVRGLHDGTPDGIARLAFGLARSTRSRLVDEGCLRPAAGGEEVFDVALNEATVRLWAAIADEGSERDLDAQLEHNGFPPSYEPPPAVREFFDSMDSPEGA